MSSASPKSSIDVVSAAVRPEELEFGGQTSPDGAITLLLSDLDDASDLTQQLTEHRVAELLRDHGALVRQLVGVRGGTVVKEHGDGFMASFSSAHAALRCAVDMQRSVADHRVPELGRELGLRVGLHTGFLLGEALEFFGRNVVLAARIGDRARGGEILVSSALHEYTASDPSFEFEPRGEERFKGLLGDHEIYAVRWRERDG